MSTFSSDYTPVWESGGTGGDFEQSVSFETTATDADDPASVADDQSGTTEGPITSTLGGGEWSTDELILAATLANAAMLAVWLFLAYQEGSL
ncbi:hypothetical protein [Halomicrobium urmianum]|uniref:hypothetical protein n=1 Tax=Halomicrobium urmianum TaxID=1586233 RepID=UPI001CD976AF|nr:hypothetical protein [Halomicrobium urmianum]